MNKTYTHFNPDITSGRSSENKIPVFRKPDTDFRTDTDPPDEIISRLLRLSQSLDVFQTQQAGEVLFFSN